MNALGKITFCCLFYLLFLSVSNANSQANIYHPFRLDQNPEWRVDDFQPYFCGYWGCGICSQWKYFVKGDTTFNSLHYYKIFYKYLELDDTSYAGAIREDTANKKIYVLYSNYETLLYNFDLQLGDTLICNNGAGHGIVESIDSILVGTEQHRRINFFNDWGFPIAIIEGIGSNTGLFQGFGNGTGFEGNFDDLKCFKLNDILQYQDTLIACTDCDFALSVSDHYEEDLEFFFPNPSDKNVKLNFPISIQSIALFSTNGKLLRQFNHLRQSKFDLDVSDLSSGMYFITASSNNKIYRGEILVEH